MASELSSEILEKQFGQTNIEILYQTATERIICTRVTETGQVVEVSQVRFEPGAAEAFPAVHRAVVGGQSMGKAFRTAGVEFDRQQTASYHFMVPDIFRQWFGSNKPAEVSEVKILVGEDSLPYADILEIYSPLVNWPVTGETPSHERAQQISHLAEMLGKRI